MKKTVIAAAAAMLIAGSAIAQAASPASPAQATQPAGNRDGGRAERHAFPEAKLNKLKDSLKLTEDQQKLWPAFETALREVSQERTARWTEFRARRQAMRQGEAQRPDTVTHLRNAADRMTNLAGEMTKVADALTPLYQSFDAAQKEKFDETVRRDLRGFFGMMSPPRRGERPGRG